MPLLFAGREFMKFFKDFYVYEFYLVFLRQIQSESYGPSALRLVQFFMQKSKENEHDKDKKKRFRKRALMVLRDALAFYKLSGPETIGHTQYQILDEYLESLREGDDSTIICRGDSPNGFCQRIVYVESPLCHFCMQPMVKVDY